MRSMKKMVFVAMVGFTAMSFVCAQGAKEESATEGPVTIKLMTADNTYGLASDPELQAAISDLIFQKTGVKVDPIIPPLSSFKDKLATVVNSGDMPDVMSPSQAMVTVPQMVARGQVLDLTDYIKNSEKLKMIDPAMFAQPDTGDKNYFVPYNFPKSKGIYVRKDIIDQYGLKLSSTPTTEEFRTEMKKLLGTGVQPFTFPKWIDNFQFFYNSFGAWGGVYMKDGKFIDGFQTPEMKEALTYLHELYEEGIINKEFITTENSQMREKTYTAQSAADIDYMTNYINYVQQTAAAGKPTEMQILYKLVGPRGEGGSLNEATQTAWVISSKTKHPKEAFKVIEAIVTDPELYAAFYGVGVKDKHYTLDANGGIVPTDRAKNSGYKYTLNYLSDAFCPIDLDNMPYKLNDMLKAGIVKQRETIKAATPYLGPNHSADVPVGLSDEYDRVNPSIKSTRESIVSKIVVGSVTVDQGMAEYENFWKSINGPAILDELNSKSSK